MDLNGLLMTCFVDHIKYCLFSYGHGKLFEPTAFFFHPQI